MEKLKKVMKFTETDITRITLKTGIYTAIGLIAYFTLMSVMNLHHNLTLHYLNIIVLFTGLRSSIKRIAQINGNINYFEGLKAGIIVSIVSVVIFNIFMLIYTTLLDRPFFYYLKENISFGNLFSGESTIIGLLGIIAAEGLSSGFIMTFILMQYYKSDNSETE
jgi:hypothetical protein